MSLSRFCRVAIGTAVLGTVALLGASAAQAAAGPTGTSSTVSNVADAQTAHAAALRPSTAVGADFTPVNLG